MKVTDLRTMKLTGPLYHAMGGVEGETSKLIIRIDTDAGIYGLGESDSFPGTLEAIQWIKKFLIGRSPFNIRPLVSEMTSGTFSPYTNLDARFGAGKRDESVVHSGWSPSATEVGPITWGVSGVEMALCDLVGKAFNTPAYNLMGGKFRDTVRVYLDRSVPNDPTDKEDWKRVTDIAIDKGFSEIKFDVDFAAADATGDIWNRSFTSRQIRLIVDRLTMVRDMIGWDVDMSVDAHRVHNAVDAIRLTSALAPLKLLWYEDPVGGLNYAACAYVRSKSPIAICIGEMFIPEQFRTAFDHGACDIIHPDVMFVGGMHALRQVSELADLHYIPTAMHSNGGCLATVAAANVAAACRNFLSLEYHFIETDWLGSYVQREGTPLFINGHIPVTDAPGLGVQLNEKVCKENLAPGESLF